MNEIFVIGKDVYLKGLYTMRDVNSNYAFPFDFPTIFSAKGRAIKSGNWTSCTSINTPDYIVKFLNQYSDTKYGSIWDIKFPNLDETENYEIKGLFLALTSIAEAYEVFRFGNRGTHKAKDIKNKKIAISISEASKSIVDRVNELLMKLPRK